MYSIVVSEYDILLPLLRSDIMPENNPWGPYGKPYIPEGYKLVRVEKGIVTVRPKKDLHDAKLLENLIHEGDEESELRECI